MRVCGISVHFGKTTAGVEFDQFIGASEWDTKVMGAFDDFLGDCFRKCVEHLSHLYKIFKVLKHRKNVMIAH